MRNNIQPEELWSFARKALSFDEPSAKSLRQSRFLRKRSQRNNAREKVTSGEESLLWLELTGAAPADAALDLSRLFNLIVAWCELHRFEEIAFASWEKQFRAENHDASLPSRLQHFQPLIDQLADRDRLSPSQVRWLQQSIIASFDWNYLVENGGNNNGDGNGSQAESSALFRAFIRAAMERLQSFLPALPLDLALFSAAAESLLQLFKERAEALPREFLPWAVLLVEGPTEAILLPVFAELLKESLARHRIMVVSAGGAPQLMKRFIEMRDLVSLPLISLFDRDAGEEAQMVTEMLREQDRIFVLQSGEIEDSFSVDILVFLINRLLEKLPSAPLPVGLSDFPTNECRTDSLARLWRKRNLGAFDKVAFAESTVEEIASVEQIPEELKQIIKQIAEVAVDVDK